MNPYEILEVDKNSSIEDIKLRYKQLANQYHPDKGGDEEKFKSINLAYSILIDPIKRQSYDDAGVYYVDANVLRDSKEKLTELFNKHINKHINNESPANNDLIFLMKLELESEEKLVKEKVKLITQSLEKLEVVRSKCKLKKQRENIMEDIIVGAIDNCNKDLGIAKHQEKVCTYTMLILNNYHYSEYDFFEQLT